MPGIPVSQLSLLSVALLPALPDSYNFGGTSGTGRAGAPPPLGGSLAPFEVVPPSRLPLAAPSLLGRVNARLCLLPCIFHVLQPPAGSRLQALHVTHSIIYLFIYFLKLLASMRAEHQPATMRSISRERASQLCNTEDSQASTQNPLPLLRMQKDPCGMCIG